LFNEGRFSELEQINLDILARRPGDETASLALAQFYQKQGRQDDALQLLEDFCDGPRSSLGISVLLTSIYAQRGDSDRVESFLNKMISRGGAVLEYKCAQCNHREPLMRWHCPECNTFDSYNSAHAQ
jgi:lipopolysaccharide biosynthesis regulator YciM